MSITYHLTYKYIKVKTTLTFFLPLGFTFLSLFGPQVREVGSVLLLGSWEVNVSAPGAEGCGGKLLRRSWAIPTCWCSRPCGIFTSWVPAGPTDLYLTNRTWQKRDMASISDTASPTRSFTHSERIKLPGWGCTRERPRGLGVEGGFQPTAGEELRPSVHQCTRNWILLIIARVSLKVDPSPLTHAL